MTFLLVLAGIWALWAAYQAGRRAGRAEALAHATPTVAAIVLEGPNGQELTVRDVTAVTRGDTVQIRAIIEEPEAGADR